MTFGALIDRTFRDFLEVVSEQTAQAPISSTVATGASTVTHDDVLTPEEAARHLKQADPDGLSEGRPVLS